MEESNRQPRSFCALHQDHCACATIPREGDPSSPAELAFIRLQRSPDAYAQWAAVARKQWKAGR